MINEEKRLRLKTGCEPIDSLLGGGWEKRTISQIYGAAGTGKTNICIQSTIKTLSSGDEVVYIDVESGFSPDRFLQISGGKEYDRFLLFEPDSLSEQKNIIKNIEKWITKNLGLVILDSAVALFRVEDEEKLITRDLGVQMVQLSRIAKKYNIPVLITNQVYTNIADDRVEPVGGMFLQYWSKTIIMLEKTDKANIRRATLIKHRSRPEKISAHFKISETGLGSV